MQIIESTFGEAHKVDREAGVIYGVKILGAKSRNGRTYSAKAMKEAVGLYEGKQVHIDHPDKKNAAQERSVRDHIGQFRNVRFEEYRMALVGDFHYLKSHPESDAIAERAERMPDTFGMSHVADGDCVRNGSEVVVESIKSVLSVDIVTDPATNTSLFESFEEQTMPVTKTVKQLLESKVRATPHYELLFEMEDQAMVAEDMPVEVADESSPEDQIKAGLLAAINKKVAEATPEELKKVLKIFGLQDSLTGATGSKSTETPAEEATDTSAETPEEQKTEESARLKRKANLLEAENRILKSGRKATKELIEAVAASSDPDKLLEQIGTTANKQSRPFSSPSRFREGYEEASSSYRQELQKLGENRWK